MKKTLTYRTDEKLEIVEPEETGGGIVLYMGDSDEQYYPVSMTMTLDEFETFLAEATAFAKYIRAKTGQS